MFVDASEQLQHFVSIAGLSPLEEHLVRYHHLDLVPVARAKLLSYRQFRVLFPDLVKTYTQSYRDCDDPLRNALASGMEKVKAVLVANGIVSVASMLNV